MDSPFHKILFLQCDAIFQEIDGGNHGGFGDYGHKKGDGEPTITNKEQMNYTSEAILKLLDSIN